jgi:hypothetical protein
VPEKNEKHWIRPALFDALQQVVAPTAPYLGKLIAFPNL